MHDINEENSQNKIIPRNNDNKDYNLKENLLSEDINNNVGDKKDEENIVISIPKHNEETAFTEN